MDAIIWLIVLVGIGVLMARGRRTRGAGRRPGGIGSAAVGSVYGMLNEDKRNAVEIIVEGRAEARDAEHADGNLPDLEDPGGGLHD